MLRPWIFRQEQTTRPRSARMTNSACTPANSSCARTSQRSPAIILFKPHCATKHAMRIPVIRRRMPKLRSTSSPNRALLYRRRSVKRCHPERSEGSAFFSYSDSSEFVLALNNNGRRRQPLHHAVFPKIHHHRKQAGSNRLPRQSNPRPVDKRPSLHAFFLGKRTQHLLGRSLGELRHRAIAGSQFHQQGAYSIVFQEFRN